MSTHTRIFQIGYSRGGELSDELVMVSLLWPDGTILRQWPAGPCYEEQKLLSASETIIVPPGEELRAEAPDDVRLTWMGSNAEGVFCWIHENGITRRELVS